MLAPLGKIRNRFRLINTRSWLRGTIVDDSPLTVLFLGDTSGFCCSVELEEEEVEEKDTGQAMATTTSKRSARVGYIERPDEVDE